MKVGTAIYVTEFMCVGVCGEGELFFVDWSILDFMCICFSTIYHHLWGSSV